MSDFDPSAPPVRVALLLPEADCRVWQQRIAAALNGLPEIEVRIVRVAATHAADAQWRRWRNTIAELGAAEPASVDHVGLGEVWDAVIDLAGIAEPSHWRARSARGVWQLLDSQGGHLAAAYPCHASITSGQGGELALVRDGAQVLDRARFFADPYYPASLGQAYRSGEILLCAAVRELARPASPQPVAAFAPQPRAGSLSRALHGLRGRALAWRRRLKAQWLSESWMIGVVDAPIQGMLAESFQSRIRWLGERGRSGYRADPFGVPGDTHRLYCESYDYDEGFGRLESLRLDEQDRIVEAAPAGVRLPGHLSYPYLFEHDGGLYAVPETAARRRCELFRIDQAGQWQPVTTLLEDVAAVDASLFAWGGRFWLAYTDLALGAFDNLCLSYADDLRGPWQRHARYPVKLDHRSARPAGTPFVHEGALYRPAQDCASGYGQAVVLNRVELCTPDSYREQIVAECRPDPRGLNPHGLHTVSAWGERTLVDGKRYVFSPRELGRKLRQRRDRTFGSAGR